MIRWDDTEAFDDDVVALGNEAYGALCRARKHSANKRTDGVLSRAMCLLIAPIEVWETIASVLRPDGSARFVERLAGGAVQLVGYLQWNHSAEQRNKDRESVKLRVSKHRIANSNADPASGVTSTVTPLQEPYTLAPGSGSGSDLEGVQGEPFGRSADHVAIALQIRQHECFRGLNAHKLADDQVGHMGRKAQKLEWVIEAIRKCAAVKTDLGLTAEALQKALVGYMHAADGRGARRAAPVQTNVEPLGSEGWRKRQQEREEAARKAGGT